MSVKVQLFQGADEVAWHENTEWLGALIWTNAKVAEFRQRKKPIDGGTMTLDFPKRKETWVLKDEHWIKETSK